MGELQCVLRLRIHEGRLEEFERLAAQCVELVRSRDTGTLQFEMYLSGDGSECLVFERYRDSRALLDHRRNLGDTLAAVFATCSASGAVCGTPDAELMERLESSTVEVFRPFAAAGQRAHDRRGSARHRAARVLSS